MTTVLRVHRCGRIVWKRSPVSYFSSFTSSFHRFMTHYRYFSAASSLFSTNTVIFPPRTVYPSSLLSYSKRMNTTVFPSSLSSFFFFSVSFSSSSSSSSSSGNPLIAVSLNELYQKRSTVTQLCLSASNDLKCVNLMCEKLGYGCACRLALALERCSQLQLIDISENLLPLLPDSLWSSTFTKSLEILKCNNNRLTSLSLPPKVQKLASALRSDTEKTSSSLSAKENSSVEEFLPLLRFLDLRDNRLTYEIIQPLLILFDYGYLPSLKVLLLQGNPGLEHDTRWKNHTLFSSKQP